MQTSRRIIPPRHRRHIDCCLPLCERPLPTASSRHLLAKWKAPAPSMRLRGRLLPSTRSTCLLKGDAGTSPNRCSACHLVPACVGERFSVFGRWTLISSKGVIHILQSRTFAMDGKPIVKLPKSNAGRRTISVPRPVMNALIQHLETFTPPEPEALVVVGRGDSNLSRDALQGSWERARLAIGRPDLRLHDMRHTGLTLGGCYRSHHR